jgi:hypothetical protein
VVPSRLTRPRGIKLTAAASSLRTAVLSIPLEAL